MHHFVTEMCTFLLQHGVLWHWTIYPSHKSHNASDTYPTMHHFVTEMCTFLLQNGALWDWCIVRFAQQVYNGHIRSCTCHARLIAQLLCHVQSCVVISSLEYGSKRTAINFSHFGNIVSEINPILGLVGTGPIIKHYGKFIAHIAKNLGSTSMDIGMKISCGIMSNRCWYKGLCHLGIMHYSDVIMSTISSLITSVSTVCLTVCSGADQRKHQSSTSLAIVRGIPRWPLNSPHKMPVTREMFPFDDVIMLRKLATNVSIAGLQFSQCYWQFWSCSAERSAAGGELLQLGCGGDTGSRDHVGQPEVVPMPPCSTATRGKCSEGTYHQR